MSVLGGQLLEYYILLEITGITLFVSVEATNRTKRNREKQYSKRKQVVLGSNSIFLEIHIV